MVLAKSKNAVGLGNSLMNDRFGKGKGQDMRRGPTGITRTGPDGQTYVMTPKQEAAWMKMQSVTEQNDLDEFLSTAELAGTDFTAKKTNNVTIIHRDQKNPYLLSAAEERVVVKRQNANKQRLRVPRRPPWNETTTSTELDERERRSLMDWRRDLAYLQEKDDLLMTPFERNIEVWRQLWRVIERSDLVVQIVDARNPLLFRCLDLETYVKEVDPKKNNLLLVNKADMMTLKQRQAWAEYFQNEGINFRFFSASLAKSLNDMKDDSHSGSEVEEEGDEEGEEESNEDGQEDKVIEETLLAQEAAKIDLQEQEEQEDDDEWASEEEDGTLDMEPSTESTRIITTDELESLFLQYSPSIEVKEDSEPEKTTIGLVGYPNVGKSSTINALIGAKKVSVSATPGKTKHFQTIHLSDAVVLCDCPGLVFPNFANTKAELVCNGVLPIDQMREYTGPSALVAERIPRAFLEAIYGFKIQTKPLEEGGTNIPTGSEVLRAYASARGFTTTSGLGQPDESRAARYVLKDYVKGKLLYCHPPPASPPIDGHEFNRELYDINHVPQKRQAALFAQEEESELSNSQNPSLMNRLPPPPVQGQKSKNMDKRFFGPGQGADPAAASSKKHFKANKRKKGKTVEYT